MTYQEEIDVQKEKFFALAKRLDSFWNGFSGPDPKWDIPYPVRSAKGRWGRCYACRYKKTTGFGFANRLCATVDMGENTFDFDMSHIWFNRRAALESADDVIAWLNVVEKDPVRANRRVAQEYPNDERKGIVPRSVVERYVPSYSIGKALGKAKSKMFSDIFDTGYFWREENAYVENMTANKFFEYCRIAYIAAEEKDDHLDKSLSGREMYDRYSDGRYGALLDIDPDSPDEFLAWLDGKVPCDKHGGDHPWEIKRGGNTTHIDLYVHRRISTSMYIVLVITIGTLMARRKRRCLELSRSGFVDTISGASWRQSRCFSPSRRLGCRSGCQTPRVCVTGFLALIGSGSSQSRILFIVVGRSSPEISM